MVFIVDAIKQTIIMRIQKSRLIEVSINSNNTFTDKIVDFTNDDCTGDIYYSSNTLSGNFNITSDNFEYEVTVTPVSYNILRYRCYDIFSCKSDIINGVSKEYTEDNSSDDIDLSSYSFK